MYKPSKVFVNIKSLESELSLEELENILSNSLLMHNYCLERMGGQVLDTSYNRKVIENIQEQLYQEYVYRTGRDPRKEQENREIAHIKYLMGLKAKEYQKVLNRPNLKESILIRHLNNLLDGKYKNKKEANEFVNEYYYSMSTRQAGMKLTSIYYR